MNIFVCAKQVPDTNEIKIDPVTNTLVRKGVPSILNTYDSLSRADLELKTGHNKTKIIRVLNELIDYGMVEVLGRGRATKYQSIK